MHNFIITILLTLFSFSAFSQSKIQRPKLVIGIVVDQMRQEYLLRFNDEFRENGFKRLVNEGFMLRNAHYSYVPTYTGPGHASIYTGTTPNVHGIIANDWYDRKLGEKVNCVEDSTVGLVGGKASYGKSSPHYLLSTTITDELRLSTHNRSKVISISLKNRGAILPGGHNPNGAFWYDDEIEGFVSSTWYMDELPQWVSDYNAEKTVAKYMKGKWETLLPIEQYTASTPDDTPYEYIWKGRDKPTFPYDLKKLQKDNRYKTIFNQTPYGNDIVKELALKAVSAEGLGKDTDTDFLAISFSAGDRIGHYFGPNSIEIQDTYLRLDQNIAEILNYLDEKVGKGNYTVFLTSDHGVGDVWKHMQHEKQPNDLITKEVLKSLYQSMSQKYGEGNWIAKATNNQVYLDDDAIAGSKYNKLEMISFLKEKISMIEGMSSVYSSADMINVVNNRSDLSFIYHAYNAQRSGDIMFTFEPGWIYESSYYAKHGAPHFSHYTYDTHVPMVFYGWGIPKGSSVKYHPVIDIAPTLSMLLNIKLPSASTGDPIEEIFEK